MDGVTQTDRKDIVPTLVIGVGGTGLEVILRVRRLITESYGNLNNFPIVGFLHIDTDSGYKASNPLMIGPPLEEGEKYYSKVTLAEVQKIVKDPDGWDWYHEWLPPELINNPQLLASQEGAGQIRACGRFSFFFNRDKIGNACQRLKKEIRKGEHTSFMQEKYQLKVKPELNVFVACSIAGGTGSGMLIDLGYSLQNWLFSGEKGDLTAIICTPDAFSNVSANDRVQCNGYAALMELNYFSDRADDPKTKFSVRYGRNEGSRVENEQAPYSYTYLIGSTNEFGVNLNLDQVREVMAQNIFLDLVSDFSPYKRSIRDNVKRAASGSNDKPPSGRSYPRNFMSFGLASIEVPVHHIRSYLASRLATDLYQWWQNYELQLPAEPETIVTSQLRAINLLRDELRQAILRAKDKSFPYQAVVQTWIGEIRQDIITNNRLQCTATGIGGILAKEKGKIIEFIDRYLRPQVDDYKRHFDDSSPDKRTHGDYLRVMYDNQAMVIKKAETELREQLYANLSDRNLGPKFVRLKLEEIKRSFETDIERFSKEAEKQWLVIEGEARKQYEDSLSRMNEMIPRPGLEKQSLINQQWDDVSKYLGQNFNAFLERKSRILAIEVLQRMKEYISQLERQFNNWQEKIEKSKIKSQSQAQELMNQADALEIVGIKLFDRGELNEWYDDFLAKVVNTDETNIKFAAQNGLNVLCGQLTEKVLENSSGLWIEDRPAQALFRLFDIEKIKDIQYFDFEKIVYHQTQVSIKKSGKNTKFIQNIDACSRFMQEYSHDPDRNAKIQELFEQSKPLVRLDQNIPQNSEFSYINFAKAGLLGGDNPQDPAAQKQAEILRRYFNEQQAIAPLTEKERHKILAIHEVGGFSLRCIQGMERMRESYQLWRGQRIEAERRRLRGQMADIPPSVHIQKDFVFWDFIPPDPQVEEIVVICRALEILRDEINQSNQQPVIRYTIEVQEEQEKVTLAANWEDAVQVLQLPDCRNDKEELKRQLKELLYQAETPAQKQQIQHKLDSYLKKRLLDFRRQGEEDNPRYLRERDIIREFSRINQLKPSPSGGMGFKVDSIPQGKSEEYEQYLAQLWNLKVPLEAFISAASSKASELQIDEQKAEAIWNKFINPSPPPLTPEEVEYEKYLGDLSNLNVPSEAFMSSANAKASALGLDSQKADAIRNKFLS
jgi:hypothetical protein